MLGFGLWFYYQGKPEHTAGLATLTQDPLHLVKSSAIENQSHALTSWTTFLELQAFLTPEHCLPPSGICS